MPPDNSADADLTPASLVFPTIFEGFFTCPSYPAFRVRGSPSSPSTRCLHAGLPPSLEGPSPASLSKGSPPGSPGWHSFPWPALWLPWASCEVDALAHSLWPAPRDSFPNLLWQRDPGDEHLSPKLWVLGDGQGVWREGVVWSSYPLPDFDAPTWAALHRCQTPSSWTWTFPAGDSPPTSTTTLHSGCLVLGVLGRPGPGACRPACSPTRAE